MREPGRWPGARSVLGLSGWEILRIDLDTLSSGLVRRTYHVVRDRLIWLPQKCPNPECKGVEFTRDGREIAPSPTAPPTFDRRRSSITNRRKKTSLSLSLSDLIGEDPSASPGLVVTDTPSFGEAVQWIIYRRRLICKSCLRKTFETLPLYIDVRSGMTARCHRYVQHQATTRPFLNIAKEIGKGVTVVRDVSIESFPSSKIDREIKRPKHKSDIGPRYLGIDEIFLVDRSNPDLAHLKSPRATFVDLESGNVLDLLENNSSETITTWFLKLTEEERRRIRGVAIDGKFDYGHVVRKVLPHATLVIDRFHIETLAQNAADSVRIAELKARSPSKKRKTTKAIHQNASVRMYARLLRAKKLPRKPDRRQLLKDYLLSYPLTRQAFEARQDFGIIYDTARTKEEADARFRLWEHDLAPDIQPHFSSLLSALRSNRKEILAYFEIRITNAATESANAMIRRIVRAGHSIHLETLAGKVKARTRLRETRMFVCDKCHFQADIEPDHHTDVKGDLVCLPCRSNEPRTVILKPRESFRDLFDKKEIAAFPRALSRRRLKALRGEQIPMDFSDVQRGILP